MCRLIDVIRPSGKTSRFRYATRTLPSAISYQRTLFGASQTSIDPTLASVERIRLDARAWIDILPGWVRGADTLFESLLQSRPWRQRHRRLYDREVLEPRLTALWAIAPKNTLDNPLEPLIVEQMRVALGQYYGILFDSVGFNLYRDGSDGVAWHRDTIRSDIAEPIVPLVSLGEPRKLHFRPRGGGRSHAFALGHGDLLVTGGTTQRTWEHAVLKVARAGARVSIAFRWGLDSRGYD
jgi:alkylated DNA repair dioxygenase AlkB